MGTSQLRPNSSIHIEWNLGVSPARQTGLQRALLGGWDLAGVVTIQSGTALTIADTNATNVFGISEDRAQLSGTCSKSQLVRAAWMESKLNNYFNASCFTNPAIIGARWHRSGVWGQCNGDCRWSWTGEPGSRPFKDRGVEPPHREEHPSISRRIFQCTEPSAVCYPRQQFHITHVRRHR